MAFPTTSILYSFTGTDADPDPNFTSLANNIERISNQGAANASNTLAYYNADTYGPDCEIYVALVVQPAGVGTCAVLARMVQVGSVATVDGYAFQLTKAAGTDTMVIQRIDNAVGTTLGAGFSQEVTNGDLLGLECIGSDIAAYFKDTAGSWTQLATRSDATHGAAGNIGLSTSNTTTRFDELGGGTVVVSSAIPRFMHNYRRRRTA